MESQNNMHNNSLHDYLVADPRTVNWPLLFTPWPIVAILSLYLYVTVKGPQWMRYRPAFNIKYIIISYNLAVILLSGYVMKELFLASVMQSEYCIQCQPVNYSREPSAVRLARAIWLYFISKNIELLDTVFFILRKKNNQLSFLHIYHHATMVPLWWLTARHIPGGSAAIAPMLNCFIHVLMYTYYLLSAMGPSMQKYLWWKRYMTKLQLAQFAIVVAHTMRAIQLDCGFPIPCLQLLLGYVLTHLTLFTNFYYQTYLTVRPAPQPQLARAAVQDDHDKSDGEQPVSPELETSRSNVQR